MRISDITGDTITVTMGEYEARLLAAACLSGAYEIDEGSPTVNPFDGHKDKPTLYAALESWQALFEAAASTSYAISVAPMKQQPGLTLAALRAYPPDDYADIGPEERAAKVAGAAKGGAACNS